MQKMIFTVLMLIVVLRVAQACSRETAVISSQSGECKLSVEIDNEWPTLRLRAHHPDYKGCDIGEDDMISILSAAFSKTEPPTLEGKYTSLFIGRLIDYPWLSHYLAYSAYQDSGWNRKNRTGTPNIRFFSPDQTGSSW